MPVALLKASVTGASYPCAEYTTRVGAPAVPDVPDWEEEHPLATTDTTAALRAVEIEAGALLKGTHSGTDGIYTDDPRTNPDAVRLDEVTYLDVLNQGLKAMDSTAITLCMDNDLPIVMFDLMGPGNVRAILEGGSIGTLVH